MVWVGSQRGWQLGKASKAQWKTKSFPSGFSSIGKRSPSRIFILKSLEKGELEATAKALELHMDIATTIVGTVKHHCFLRVGSKTNSLMMKRY